MLEGLGFIVGSLMYILIRRVVVQDGVVSAIAVSAAALLLYGLLWVALIVGLVVFG